MERDRALERRLLSRTGHGLLFPAGALDGYRDQVVARLDHTEAKHGNAGWDRPVDELLQEMQEEAADITGWGIGAAHQLAEPLHSRLIVPMSLGAAAWRELEEIRELLATGRD